MDVTKDVITFDEDMKGAEETLNRLNKEYALVGQYFYQVGDRCRMAGVLARMNTVGRPIMQNGGSFPRR